MMTKKIQMSELKQKMKKYIDQIDDTDETTVTMMFHKPPESDDAYLTINMEIIKIGKEDLDETDEL